MITKTEFAAIDSEIKTAVNQTLIQIKDHNQNDYALYLADGEYRKEYNTPEARLSPYVINDKVDLYKDLSRLQFLSEFLTRFYSFADGKNATDDNEQRLHMEMMVYSHIWEAQPFLKRLYRIAHQSTGEQYAWEVEIPEMGKHNFIIKDIRKTFEKHGNALFEIIKKGFHTSLRNAFAHSDYYFDPFKDNKRIILDNYGGQDWELKEIKYDDWSKRFVYSALLSYHLLSISYEHRKKIESTAGTNSFQIKVPHKTVSFKMIWIKYDNARDSFAFE